MGLKLAVLGETADNAIEAAEIARRVAENHPLAAWKPESIDVTIREVTRRQMLQPQVDGQRFSDARERWKCMPLELTPAGRRVLRRGRLRRSPPAAFRDHLLFKIEKAEQADLPELDELIGQRLEWVRATADAISAGCRPRSPRTELSWKEKRKIVARRFDLHVLDGLDRGLRSARSEIRSEPPRDDSP